MAEKQKHVVNVTISDPNHTMVSKRKEKFSRRATVSADSKESAVQGALRFYRKQGLKVHDHDYVGLKEEVEQMDEAAMTKKRAAADIMFKRHADKVAKHEKAASAAYDKGDTKLGDEHTAIAQKHDSIAQKHYNTLHRMGRAPSRMDQSWHPTNEAIKPKSKEDEGEYGYEGDMAMSQLRSIIRNSQAMLDNLDEKTDLPEWVQSKITLAKDYIETSANYLMSELEEEVKPDRRNPSKENQTRRAFIDARKKKRQVNEGIVSGALKVAGKVFNAPAYTWAGENLEKREKAKKLAAKKAARKTKKVKVTESAKENAKIKRIMDKYKGIRNRVNTKPELEVSLRNTSSNILGNVSGYEGPKPNEKF